MYSPIYFDDTTSGYKQQALNFKASWKEYVVSYFMSLFPIIGWLPRYNLAWLQGDLLAGITIGCVVVPQGMAYAKLAGLSAQYGLYSSFTGVFLYCFFATSKDITIGPVAVMSLLVGTIVADIPPHWEYTKDQVASTLSLMGGLIVFGIGLFRFGYIIELISGPAIAGFMSGSALNIGIGQLAGLFGVPNINTRAATYLVLYNTLKHLNQSQRDAAFGLLSLFVLYVIKYGTEYLAKKYPRWKRSLFFFSTARSVMVVIVTTIIAYGISHHNPSKPPIKLNGTVPAGLRSLRDPIVSQKMLDFIGPNLPVVALILVLEHVAIAKSFGRLNDYVINPNQELIAIGVANIFGSFFSSYPATGSFSRTAIKARAGVRSPIAGIFSGLIVILALYALTPAFFYIPNAALSAIIIHAVADLFSGPKTWKQYWRVSPFELLIFAVGVIATFFSTVEIGVYCSVSLSLFILLTRIAHPRFSVLGRIPVTRKTADETIRSNVYIPVDNNTIKTNLALDPLPPGIVVVRLEEAYTYPNAAYLTDKIIEAGKAVTRRAAPPVTNRERNWNDDGRGDIGKDNLPILRAIVVDFGAVANFDSTALQALTVARASLDRYANRSVEWHFAHVVSPAIRRALNTGGFGGRTPEVTETEQLAIVPTLNSQQTSPHGSPSTGSDVVRDEEEEGDSGNAIGLRALSGDVRNSTAGLVSQERLREFIHYDLDEAVASACNSPL